MCVFCDIIEKKIPSEIVDENDDIFVIKDINPKAPSHFLIIQKKHIESIKNLEGVENLLLTKIIITAKTVAKKHNLYGYKLIFNVGKEGGQIINHLHLHLLGGWTSRPKKIDI